jgi:hypothetical protein
VSYIFPQEREVLEMLVGLKTTQVRDVGEDLPEVTQPRRVLHRRCRTTANR